MMRVRSGVLLQVCWSLVGVSIGLAAVLAVTGPPRTGFMLASLGGSAIFLFGITRSPAAQPRALVGGHLGTAAIGIACFQYFGDALWVYALAQSLALGYMLILRTMHPPAGANPLIMIASHAGWDSIITPVGLGVVLLAFTAALWSRVLPGQVRYPVSFFEPSPANATWGTRIDPNEIDQSG